MKDIWNKCDVCGKFISLQNFIDGDAKRKVITTDIEYTSEEYETLCKNHINKNMGEKN